MAKVPYRERMPLEQAFQKRTGQIYSAMKTRFGPKYHAFGMRKGQLKSPGRDMPFTLAEFRMWCIARLGGNMNGGVKCYYCPRIVTAEDFVVEHGIPVSRGGDPGFGNLFMSCALSNREKGALTSLEYAALQNALSDLLNRGALGAVGWEDIWKRLRGETLMIDKWRREKAKKSADGDDVTSPVATTGKMF